MRVTYATKLVNACFFKCAWFYCNYWASPMSKSFIWTTGLNHTRFTSSYVCTLFDFLFMYFYWRQLLLVAYVLETTWTSCFHSWRQLELVGSNYFCNFIMYNILLETTWANCFRYFFTVSFGIWLPSHIKPFEMLIFSGIYFQCLH